jgi:sugar lactone lactonase YvrE
MKKVLILSILALSASLLQAQNVYTVAGNGTAGFSGDGGLATAAELNIPYYVATDAAGNLYIADTYNNLIRKVDTRDSISTIAGNGTPGFSGDGGQATAAELNHATYIAIDKLGNIYIADYDNNRIRMINTSGIINTIAGTGGGYSGDGGQATAAGMTLPGGVAVDKSGNVYIGEYYDNRIRMINTSGIINTIAGTGTPGFTGDGGLATAAEIHGASGVWVDASENLYITDMDNNRIRIVNTSGIISTIAGNGTAGYSGDGGQATAAEINSPGNVAIDASGNIYIADFGNNTVRKINTSGIISTFAGNGVMGYSGDGGNATAAEFNDPHMVAIDITSGNLFITDLGNNRIREVTTGSPLALNKLNIDNEKINVYPNPNNGIFNIQLSAINNKSSIFVYNILGLLVYQSLLNSTNTQIDLSNNANGIYLFRVLTETGNLLREGKLLIQK